MTRRSWPDILSRAATIVRSYPTSVTLRQLYYRLVADGTIRNDLNDYTGLARTSAAAREAGTFPDLIDTRHDIDRRASFDDPDDAMDWLVNDVYRRDRTEGQPYSLYISNEKTGQAQQLRSWFGDRGIPVLTLGGWASTPFVQQVRKDIERQQRPAVLIYAGDFDPSGWVIGTNFAERVGSFRDVIRVGLNIDQILALPANPTPDKVADDPRAKSFTAEFGPRLNAMGLMDLVQYELDAIDPVDLRQLYEVAVRRFWDEPAYQASLVREQADISILMAKR